MNQTVDIERLRDLRSQLLREAENIGKSRKATQQEAYKYIEDIRRKYSQSYVQQSVAEAQSDLKAYCDSVREQEEAIYKKVDVLKTLINMYEVERYREKRAIEQFFGIMANGMRNNRSTFMSSLDRWKQEGIGWLSKGRKELGKVLVDLFQQNIETLMQSLYRNGIGKISGSKLEEMKVNLQRYYETVSQTEVPIDRVSMNLYNQLAEDLRELQVEEADIIELLKLPAEEGIKTLELLFILKGHEHQLEKESIEEEQGGKAIKQMIVKAIGEEIGTKDIADVLWAMDDSEKEALYDELGEKGITNIEEIVVDEKENVLKINCTGEMYEIRLVEDRDEWISKVDINTLVREILEDKDFDKDDNKMVSQYILRNISEATGNSAGVLMSYWEVQGTAALHVAGKTGHAVDLKGNSIEFNGFTLAATLNISAGGSRVYVYYPDYKNADDIIGNSGYGELAGGAWLVSGGRGSTNFSDDEDYWSFSGGPSVSGLPSLNVRAIPIDITPIGIDFIWEK